MDENTSAVVSFSDRLAEVGGEELSPDSFRSLAATAFDSMKSYDELRTFLEDWSPAEKSIGAKTVSEVIRGYCSLLVGDLDGAVETLSKQKAQLWGSYHLARSHLESRRLDDALAVAEPAYKKASDSTRLGCLVAEIQARRGDLDAAEKCLAAVEKSAPDAAETLVARAVVLEKTGDYAGAIDAYRAASEKDPGDPEILFRLGYLLELHGSDADEANDEALSVYERCVNLGPVHVNAAINLGLLYEDRERYHDAIRCYETVLRYHPNHARARLYLQDAHASTTMFYDREQEKKADRQSQVLKIPVTDFELSVRSRNCLQKMNIKTLGDLIMKTEQELLSYKNFGETSLEEIKQMLNQKGLRLGQGLEDGSSDASHGRNPLEASAAPEILDKSIDDLELSVRSRRCMERLGVRTLRDLINKTEMELMAAKNFGMTSLNEIKRKLAELNLALRT